ncbi:MAG: RNA pseudouridine synthase [Deltaproteobacteria bacterium]|nr:RNA pseudouridine synthase [Deltaproteobacteria bacterium]
MQVLFLDNHLFIVHKPAGMLVQGDRTGDRTLLDMARAFLKERFHKPGNVYLAIVHRLDRPVSGVLLFARTSKAAGRLAGQFRNRRVRKIYRAMVEGKVAAGGTLTHRLLRREGRSVVVEEGGREARLRFRRLGYAKGISHIEVELLTGRHHQIRVQFAHTGHPVIGDFRYGSRVPFGDRALALHARSLTILHPTRGEEMIFVDEPGPEWTLPGLHPSC